ncbi:TetR/AcrR family transcriptional regulator [Mycobacteroides abscessus subsp. massiliense]|nr:TetR/AcrR family transcriptional regulator [Mycobacteroides abscessus]MDO3000178.1 TetR/AcrR family transcriptional regulator [Mycobacteroides abscessus subsp. massiliense]
MYQKGVAATSLDDILAASSTGKSQLYHYFKDRSELVKAVVERQTELVLAAQPTLSQIDSMEGIESMGPGDLGQSRSPRRPVRMSAGQHGRRTQERSGVSAGSCRRVRTVADAACRRVDPDAGSRSP